MVFRKFEFRLYPNRKQKRRLGHQLAVGTRLYNKLLTIYKEEYLEKGIKLGRYDLDYHLTPLRRDDPEYGSMYRYTQIMITKRLQENLTRFFIKTSEWKNGRSTKPGMPRYKKMIRSIDFFHESVKIIDNRTVKIGKIGNVEVVIHRAIEGKVKQATVIRKESGKWFIIFTTDVEISPTLAINKPEIGLDVGLLSFATLSNGTTIENPRFLQKMEKRINRLQKDLSRKRKGSNNWRRAKRLVALAYGRVENQRNDFLHKTSRMLVNEYGTIVVESLTIDQMLSDHKMAKSISDASWYKFIRMLEYKASSAGSQVVCIEPRFPSSQICSNCGYQKKMALEERKFACPNCGLVLDRDLNAAKNILDHSRAGSARIHACEDGATTSFIREKRAPSLNQELYA